MKLLAVFNGFLLNNNCFTVLHHKLSGACSSARVLACARSTPHPCHRRELLVPHGALPGLRTGPHRPRGVDAEELGASACGILSWLASPEASFEACTLARLEAGRVATGPGCLTVAGPGRRNVGGSNVGANFEQSVERCCSLMEPSEAAK